MKVAIIGGGAAGLMATATVIESAPDAEVFLIERNAELGKKVIISGGGRCNVTTGIRDVREVLKRYPRGGKFLSSAMYGFPPEAVYGWFEAHGVPLKTEEDLRVFPRSDRGKDIVGVFERLFAASGVHVLLKSAVTDVEKDASGFVVRIKDKDPLFVDVVMLATGGQAYRHTGSTGDGYAFATGLGHTLTPLAASLNSFTTAETWPAGLSGLSFGRARISSSRNKAFTFTGPFLFTHRGVSGPAVFALSSLVAFETYDASQPLPITIDLFPDERPDDLHERLSRKGAEFPKKSLANVLAMLVPKSLAETALGLTEVDGGKKAVETPKKAYRRLAEWLKGIPLSAVGRGAGDEFVTAGGIPLSEIDPRTMESRVVPGLYFGGEIMDVDGFTGGFNLQASWAAGRLAGKSIAGKALETS